MAEFTPGPWRLDAQTGEEQGFAKEGNGYDYLYIWDILGPENEHVLCFGHDYDDLAAIRGKTEQERRANARLISSAPDLYEALTWLWTITKAKPHQPSEYVQDRVRAALAKAEGRDA